MTTWIQWVTKDYGATPEREPEKWLPHLRKTAGVQFNSHALKLVQKHSSGDLKSCQVYKTECFGFKGGCGMHVAKHLKENWA